MTTPESLFAEHKEAAKRVLNAEGTREANVAHLAHINENPGNPYSDQLDRNGIMEDLTEANVDAGLAREAYNKNIEQAKAHLNAHPGEYK